MNTKKREIPTVTYRCEGCKNLCVLEMTYFAEEPTECPFYHEGKKWVKRQQDNPRFQVSMYQGTKRQDLHLYDLDAELVGQIRETIHSYMRKHSGSTEEEDEDV